MSALDNPAAAGASSVQGAAAMTLVFERDSKNPGTHALIVASGDVPRSPGGTSMAPASAGTAIAHWLIDSFHNPTAELASVDFLASGPSAQVAFVRPDASAIPLQPPRFDTFEEALRKWLGRLQSNPRNIAFFYYVGYVFRTPEPLLALQDYSDGRRPGTGRPISFASVSATMRNCQADRQLYLLDGIPLHVGKAVMDVVPYIFAPTRGVGKPGRIVPGWAVAQADTPVKPAALGTPFSDILRQALDPPRLLAGRAWVSAQDIIDAQRRALNQRGGRLLAVETVRDFDVHYPKTEPDEAKTEFVLDDAEADRDALGRSALAIGLGRRLHKIWRQTNDPAAAPAAAAQSRAAFVVHLDAPWGGGKTSFANFLARVLNPCPPGRPAAAFLGEHFPGADLGGIFLDDPPPDAAAAEALAMLPADARRPWITVTFNAWQAEHCAPPWWVFYQAIRTDCFKAIRTEGDGAWVPRPPSAAPAVPAARTGLARRWRAFAAGAGGKVRWLYLVLREYVWRFFNPRILSVLLVGVAASAVLFGLYLTVENFELAKWLGILSGGLAGLWGLAAFFTESVAPGTAGVAERLSLGARDPFARFRTHFARMMERVRRPVMVVVDDLDRCRPDFVVDLVRGIQTLLRSPRVVFVILGDREWIERAFESHHAAMREVDVGPEQSFGARFVEKAIQLSFILPTLGEDGRQNYVRRVLFGEPAPRAPPPPPRDGGKAPAGKAAAPETAGEDAEPGAPREEAGLSAAARADAAARVLAAVREIVNRAAAASGVDPFDAAPVVAAVVDGLRRLLAGGDIPKDPDRLVDAALRDAWSKLIDDPATVEQMVGEALAIRATTDEAVEREVTHELQRLAAFFPANPRQIKRIVNAITIYHAMALQRPGVTPDAAFRGQLALWIIIMTEWPRTWRLLASFPDLVDILASARPGSAIRRKGLALPGSIPATERALDEIRSDGDLLALIAGDQEEGRAPLETRHVRVLAELTPLYSRRRRLPGGADDAPKAKRAPRAGRPGNSTRPR